MGILDTILDGSSEKRIMDRGVAIIEKAVAENKLLVNIINGYNDLPKAREIKSLSDKEVFEISNSITSGGIAPNLIDDMLRFVRKEDDIVDAIFNLCRAVGRYNSSNDVIKKYVKENLTQISELTSSALKLLHEMHKAETIANARIIRLKIEEIEQKGDDIKDAMLDYSYKSKDVDFRSFYYLQDIAHRADDVLDACEDSSDMIMSIMRSILT